MKSNLQSTNVDFFIFKYIIFFLTKNIYFVNLFKMIYKILRETTLTKKELFGELTYNKIFRFYANRYPSQTL